ncbi:MAG: hypothetical protein ABWY03_01375 [Microbacterium sp.]
MEAVWITLGVVVLVIAMADTFLSVLNYNERGLVVNRVARGAWVAARTVTRRLPRRYRQLALRQVTGFIMVSVIVTWIAGVVLGFALIYYGAMQNGAIDIRDGAPHGFWGALYMSIGQFSTVGVEDISAVHPVIDFLTVVEALSCVVLLSLIVAFLVNVFNGIQMLRSLCADVSRPAEGDATPLAALYPFFPHGEASDVERYLTSTWGDMNLYGDVLRQTRTTYYFQSGDEQFSAPFALASIAQIVGGLRWGLPVGTHPVSRLPGLFRLEESLAAARRWITTEMLRLPAQPAPAPVSAEEFTGQLARLRGSSEAAAGVDPFVAEFDHMCRAVARLVSPTQSDDLALQADPGEAYQRYVQWLPFGAASTRFDAALSRDLDYQPHDHDPTSLPFTAAGVARALPAAS